MNLRTLLQGRAAYLCWTAASAAALAATSFIDPYIFALAAFVSAALAGVLGVAVAALAPRRLPWALLGAVPTAVSFAVLSTYKWA